MQKQGPYKFVHEGEAFYLQDRAIIGPNTIYRIADGMFITENDGRIQKNKIIMREGECNAAYLNALAKFYRGIIDEIDRINKMHSKEERNAIS